jgi:capsular exopolysaccharide synthesis family protein
MSRIQQILDKAEREGGVRRVRTEPAVASAPETAVVAGGRAAGGVPSFEPRSTLSAPTPAAPTLTPARLVSGARLDPRLVTTASTDAVATEQYRALRTRIANADPMAPVNVVMITSPGRGEGKTLTAGNLGLAMAQEWQRRICIVDADLRHPQMHRLFGLPDGPGLCDVLTGRATLEEALVTLEEHQITILPAGHVPAHPAELLGTGAMRRTFETLRTQFDRVVVDTAPATPLADVSVLAPFVDRVLLVVRAGVTTKPSIHDAVSSIDGAKLLGLVLNEAA